MRNIAGTGLLVMLVTALFSTAAPAEENKEQQGFEAYSLGEIYVSGEKTPVTQEAAITNTITAEDIKATNSKTVAEALSYTPGIRVSTGRKNEPDVSIHGFFGQSRILVLIDGVPYYETKEGKLDLNQFTTDNVAKIEVTKGAASVLYGANAEGGVINIITKKATGKPHFAVNVEGGDVDYYKASVAHGMKAGIFNYWLNYDHRQAHGWRLSDGFKPGEADIIIGKNTSKAVTEDGGTRSQSDYRTDSFWAKFGIEPSANSEYFVNFHYISREKGIPPSVREVRIPSLNRPAFSNFYRFPTYDDWGIDLSGQQKVNDKLALKGKLFYHNHVDELASYPDQNFSNVIATSKFQDYMIGGSLITEFKPVQWNTMRLALNYRGDSHKQRDDVYLPFENFFSFTGSVGIEDEMQLAKNFSLVVGGSYDWFKVTDANSNTIDKATGNLTSQNPLPTGSTTDSFNPMIGAVYTFPDSTKLFASVARKTRFPTLGQLFASASKGGNKDLNSEVAINSTVGVSRAFSDYMWGQLAFFYHDISDFITRTSIGPASPYQNIGQIEVYGIEVDTQFYPMRDLTLRLGYNFNHATDMSKDKVTDLVANVPEHKLDMGVQYTVPITKTRVDLNGILISEVFGQVPVPTNPTQSILSTPGYFFVNARVSQKFLDNFEAYIAINNIFDRNYEAEFGFPGQGRNIFGGVTARF
jgi:iron complex outermembrane recepter protein